MVFSYKNPASRPFCRKNFNIRAPGMQFWSILAQFTLGKYRENIAIYCIKWNIVKILCVSKKKQYRSWVRLDHYHQLCQPWFLDWELYLRRSPPFISSDRSSLRNLAQIESNARNKPTNKKFNNHTNRYKKNGSWQKTLLGKLGPGPNCPEPNLPGTTKKTHKCNSCKSIQLCWSKFLSMSWYITAWCLPSLATWGIRLHRNSRSCSFSTSAPGPVGGFYCSWKQPVPMEFPRWHVVAASVFMFCTICIRKYAWSKSKMVWFDLGAGKIL